MNIEIFLQYFLLFAIIFDISIAWFVLLKKLRRAVNQTYFFMVCCITLWQLSNYLLSYTLLPEQWDATFIMRLGYAAASMIVFSLTYLISIFGEEKHQWKNVLYLSPFIIITVVLALSPWVIQGVEHHSRTVDVGPVYHYFLFGIFLVLVMMLSLFILNWSQSQSFRRRTQYQYFALGISIPIIFGGYTNLYLPYVATASGEASLQFITELWTSVNNLPICHDSVFHSPP